MARPRIAIPVPTSREEAYNRANWHVYADAIQASGGEPFPVALDLPDSDLMKLQATADGFLLPGSPADVDPALYGQERDESCSPPDPKRERTDRLLLEHALASGKPVLGICFGMQILNVVRGGTLIQDLQILPVNHAANRGVQVAHSALVEPDSLLASMLDRDEAQQSSDFLRLPINSSHHQAVGIPGDGLAVVARCPTDGVVEAIELIPGKSGQTDSFLIGVQWHPERTFDSSESSKALFARLVAAARAGKCSGE